MRTGSGKGCQGKGVGNEYAGRGVLDIAEAEKTEQTSLESADGKRKRV